jgi:hypothetical protein
MKATFECLAGRAGDRLSMARLLSIANDRSASSITTLRLSRRLPILSAEHASSGLVKCILESGKSPNPRLLHEYFEA